ncbi:MAG: hypothetical protein IJ748_04980 [Bacteroidales bacterium]|nr:hypothetical protein [Bacteroidales bacterium]
MKKTILVLCFLFSLSMVTKAQNYVDRAFFEARAGFHNELDDGHYGKHFTGDFLNFQMFGNISDNISYRIRQRLNKNPFDSDNILNATDFLYIDWRINKHWSVMFGKQEIFIGGFEYDYAPIDVYYWSDFCNQLPQSYGMGLSLGYHYDENNTVYFQIINSPFSLGNKDEFLSYNVAWFGQAFDWWKTIWSVNYVEAEKGTDMFYVALGNRFESGDFYLEADFTEGINATNTDDIITNFSVVGKLNYNYRDKLNIFLKGGYDDNSYTYLGNALSPFVYDRDYSYFGAGAEYFPLNNKDLRLHAVYYYNNEDKKHNFDLGATWQLNIKSPNKTIGKN